LELPVKATQDEDNIAAAKESNGRRICGVKDLACFNQHRRGSNSKLKSYIYDIYVLNSA